jgi:hypothetical protein
MPNLNENKSVDLDGSGNGTLQMRPWSGNVTWHPTSVSVKVLSATKEATCKIYIGPKVADQYLVDATINGSSGNASGKVQGFNIDTHGNTLWVVWAGGDAGASATAQVNGTYE